MAVAPDKSPRWLDYVRLDTVELAPRNPKGHDGDGIARSIKHHGLGEVPLRDERTGRLVAGHGRHEQLREMHSSGATPPDGVTVDDDGMWLMPVVAGWSSRSDEDAEAYLIGSNRLTDVGGWDDAELAAVLEDLSGVNLLELTGYDQGDLDDLLAGLEESDAEGTGVRQTHTLDEDAARYEDRETRMIVLTYPVETFEWMVGKLADLADRFDVDTNSDVVQHLVKKATAE
jgi:hypothetical protein